MTLLSWPYRRLGGCVAVAGVDKDEQLTQVRRRIEDAKVVYKYTLVDVGILKRGGCLQRASGVLV